MSKTAEHSALVEAARSLEGQLERLRVLVAASARERLDSARSLARAAASLQQILELESTLRDRLLTLARAFDDTRRAQEELTELAQKRAGEIATRGAKLQCLLATQATIAEETRQLNELAREIAEQEASPSHSIEQLHERITGIVEQTCELAARARESGFPELARTGDSLRQQIHALENKLALARPANPEPA